MSKFYSIDSGSAAIFFFFFGNEEMRHNVGFSNFLYQKEFRCWWPSLFINNAVLDLPLFAIFEPGRKLLLRSFNQFALKLLSRGRPRVRISPDCCHMVLSK
jgi:hypothetical protein